MNDGDQTGEVRPQSTESSSNVVQHHARVR